MNVDFASRPRLRLSCRAASLSAALVLSGGLPAEEAIAPHLVEFHNGDRLQGQVQAFSTVDGLTLRHLASPGSLRFQLPAIREFAASPGLPAEEPSDPAFVSLANGDKIPAQIETLDGSTLHITTSWSGSFDLPWKSVRRIDFQGGANQRVFSGPSSRQDWRFCGEGSARRKVEKSKATQRPRRQHGWRVADGTLSSGRAGGCAIDAALPDRFQVEFEVEWTGHISFSFGFHADSFLPGTEKADGPTVVEVLADEEQVIPMRHGLSIDFNPHNITLQAHSQENGQDQIGNAQIPDPLYRQSNAFFRIKADRKAGVVEVWQDDTLVNRWANAGEVPGGGRAIGFWQHHENGVMRIRRINARAWDGREEPTLPSSDAKGDTVLTLEGGRFSGTLAKVEKDMWTLDGAIGRLEFPSAKIRSVLRPAHPSDSSPAPSAPLATVSLEGGARFSLVDISLADEHLAGTHELLGPVRVPMRMLERVVLPVTPSELPK